MEDWWILCGGTRWILRVVCRELVDIEGRGGY